MEVFTITIICLLLLATQLLLCFKVKKLVVKLIPAVLLLIALAVFMILLLIASGWDSLGYVVFVILSGIFMIPCAAGWVIWAICYFVKKRKNREASK